jgi:hypothetical protein
VQAAKSEGKYSEGVSDLPANSIRESVPAQTLFANPFTGRTTVEHTLTMDRGMSFEDAMARLEREQSSECDGFWRSR